MLQSNVDESRFCSDNRSIEIVYFYLIYLLSKFKYKLKRGESMNKRERNMEARHQINKIAKELGVSYSFIARQMKVEATNFNGWRRGTYEYGIAKLKQLEAIIEKYSFDN